MKKTLLVCCALLAASSAFGHTNSVLSQIIGQSTGPSSPPPPPTGCTETYCVDQANGSDSNPGTAAHPFQNLTAIPTLTAGQSVGLACESPPAHWRQQISQIGNSSANLIFTGYGSCTSIAQIITGATSNLPIIDGADIISTGWTKTGGYTNVYNTNSALTFGTACGGANTNYNGGVGCGSGPPYHSSNAFENVWEDDGSTKTGGKLMVWENSIANVDATACSYYVPNLITTGSSDGYWAIPPSGVMYIHGCNAGALNPSTNGYTYDYSNRQYNIGVGGTGITFEYFEGRKANWGDGPIVATANNGHNTFSNLIGRQFSEDALQASGGSTITNCLFIDGYFPGSTGFGGSMIIFNDAPATGLNSTVTNNIFQQDQNIPGNNASSVMITQVESGGTEGTLNFSNNWVIGKNGVFMGSIGPELNTWGAWTMNTNYFTYTNFVSYISSATTVENSVFYDPSSTTIGNLFTIQGNGSITYTNNTMCSGSWCGPAIPNVQ